MTSPTRQTTVAPLPAPPPVKPLPAGPGFGLPAKGAVLLFLAALFLPALLFAGDRYWLPLFTRFMAVALFALSVDLIWGYTGLLSLGQGLYFGLGVYAVGYSLKLQHAALQAGLPFEAGPDMALPNFMAYCDLHRVPFWIAPLINIWLALALAVVVPTVVALLFGLVTFRRRVKGVYFALITQALLLAVFTLVDNQQPYTGGRVGMTSLSRLQLFGVTFEMAKLYHLVTAILVVCFLVCAWLVRSKFGRVLTAIRDNENRVLALGYNTALYKTFVFTLAGALAGLAGALYVAALRTAGPDRFGVFFSIEIVVMVAVGGRGTLVGAVLGAVLVSLGEVYYNDNSADLARFVPFLNDQSIKEAWPLVLGALFIVVVLFLPDGIVGFLNKLAGRIGRLAARRPATPA
jgi:urea transport system permease protein